MNETQEIASGSASASSEGMEECWMVFDGARMRYLRAGSGPALVLLHGLLGYSFSWRYTMPALASYATVYAPDLLGAGFSDRPRGIDHSMHATALRVLRFVEDILHAPTITVPIANHDNNQHSFNENIRIQNLWDGIELMAALLAM